MYDIIIAGAGASGLSLLWRILNSPRLKNQKILLIDRSFEPTNDKTWCFWENLDLPDELLTDHSWNQIKVQINQSTYSEILTNHHYKCLKSEDFSSFILQQAREEKRVTFLETSIINFSSEKRFGIVHASKGEFKSNYIFQSVLKPPDFKNLKVDISLIQHFLGWEVTLHQNIPHFNTDVATFMDFDIPQTYGPSFIYLLPFAKNSALVEYTIFSDEILEKRQYEAGIEQYLKNRYNLSKKQYSIDRQEFGAIPMEDRTYPSKFCNFVWNLGITGGYAKPSTGYTFSRIQKHTSKIVHALENKLKIPEKRASSYRFRIYDIMMLYLLKYEPTNAMRAFDALFKKNNFDLILEFLSEESTFLDEIRIFSKMPYLPFFRSILKMKHRIFSGA